MVPGQGTAEAGMGAEAYDNSDRAKRIFQVGSKITKINLMDVCFGNQTEELEKTEIAQPALSASELADFLYLEELGLQPDVGEGHSMGEIPLLAMAEVISVEGMFKLIKVRGEATARASRLRPGMMARVQGMNLEQIEHELAEFLGSRLSVTNFNSYFQHMLSGDMDLVMSARDKIRQRATQVAELKNARISRTRIPPFHSKYHMQPAKRRFKKMAHSIDYSQGKFPIMLNNGMYLDELGLASLPDYVAGQLAGPVLFRLGTQRLIEDGIVNFIQVGARPVLSDLVVEDHNGRVNIINLSKITNRLGDNEI